jgi:hypothetical protein
MLTFSGYQPPSSLGGDCGNYLNSLNHNLILNHNPNLLFYFLIFSQIQRQID